MKPYRNIYILYEESAVTPKLTGKTEIPYTGEIFYNVKTDPDGFDKECDIYYKCSCDFGEIKEFKKV